MGLSPGHMHAREASLCWLMVAAIAIVGDMDAMHRSCCLGISLSIVLQRYAVTYLNFSHTFIAFVLVLCLLDCDCFSCRDQFPCPLCWWGSCFLSSLLVLCWCDQSMVMGEFLTSVWPIASWAIAFCTLDAQCLPCLISHSIDSLMS